MLPKISRGSIVNNRGEEMRVSRVAEMRNLDSQATSEFGITQETLMEKAGEAAYFVILKELGVKDKKFIIFCGTGNNGGGWICRRQEDSH